MVVTARPYASTMRRPKQIGRKSCHCPWWKLKMRPVLKRKIVGWMTSTYQRTRLENDQWQGVSWPIMVYGTCKADVEVKAVTWCWWWSFWGCDRYNSSPGVEVTKWLHFQICLEFENIFFGTFKLEGLRIHWSLETSHVGWIMFIVYTHFVS